MPCLGCKSILTQAIVLVAIGTALGIADSQLRPAKLDRPPPPPLPTNPTPPTPPTPSPTPGANGAPANPTPAAFKETPQDRLPQGQITLTAAKSLFDQQAFFIDSRKPEVFAAGHVKGAYRISEADFHHGDPPILAAIPRDSVLVIYCSGGKCDESEVVARFLDGSGYKKVYVMHDGFPGWRDMGFPIETGEGLQ